MTVRNAVHAPVPAASLPDFAPVPLQKQRHDGWTPERQKAFVEALADTGCVSIACRMVNMSQRSFYQLRRQPGATSFRAAAEAAQALGLQVVKDEAFERAMTGELIPVFVAGKLLGFRRKKNDRLLMFILRHYGTDAAGRRTTINYFSTRATAGASAQTPLPAGERDRRRGRQGEGLSGETRPALAAAEASTTTVKTVISGQSAPSQLAADDSAADLLNAFEGVALDAEAQAEIQQSLAACAERRRALEAAPEDDPDRFYIGAGARGHYLGTLEIGAEEDLLAFRSGAGQGRIGEHRWESLGEGGDAAAIDEAVASVQAALAAKTPEQREADRAAARAEIEQDRRKQSLPPGWKPAPEPDPDDPRLDWRNWAEGPPSAMTAGAIAPPRHRGEPVLSEVEGAGQPAATADRTDVTNSVRDGPPASPEKPKRPYKPRTPKPPFTPPDAEAEARARQAVAADRRTAGEAQAARRRRRR
jgi:hypothetical protein